jgi:methylglyoxal synthase
MWQRCDAIVIHTYTDARERVQLALMLEMMFELPTSARASIGAQSHDVVVSAWNRVAVDYNAALGYNDACAEFAITSSFGQVRCVLQ